MRKANSFALVAVLFGLAACVAAQGCALVPEANTIDLTAWTDIGTETVSAPNCLAANWQFPQTNTATQSSNTCSATHLVSDFSITSSDIIRGTLTGTTAGLTSPDDDYIGFSIGQNCGTSAAPTAADCSGDSISLSWGAAFSNANPGLCASRVSFPGVGVCPWGCTSALSTPDNDSICPDIAMGTIEQGFYLRDTFSCTNPNTNVVNEAGDPLVIGPGLTGRPLYADPVNFHAAQLGGVVGVDTRLDRFCAPYGLPMGWVLDRDYDFIIQSTPTRLRVFVDFVKVFDYSVADAGETQMPRQGRISLMNASQGNVAYSSMEILDTGTDSCLSDPWVYNLDVDTCGPGTFLDVSWGDGDTDTFPVPSTGVSTIPLSHVYPGTTTGFYTVNVELFDGISSTPQDTFDLLAFILDQPTVDVEPQINGECGFPMRCDANNGGVFVNLLDGGNAPYDLLWSTGDTASAPTECSGELGCATTITGLSPGSYSVSVEDANLCPAGTDSTTLFSSATTISGFTSPTCGAIDLTATSSANCLGLTYAWSTTDGTTPNPSSEDQSGLGPGTYSVVVTDANGCSDSGSFTLGFGLTNVEENDIYFMYITREIQWANFPPNTMGDVRLVCPSSNTLIFAGDLGSTNSATLTPQRILPEACQIVIDGTSIPGCNVAVDVHICTHPNVGAIACTVYLDVE